MNSSKNQKMARTGQFIRLEPETNGNVIVRSPTLKLRTLRSRVRVKEDYDSLPVKPPEAAKHLKPYSISSKNDEHDLKRNLEKPNRQSKNSENIDDLQFQQHCIHKTLNKLILKKKLTNLYESDIPEEKSDFIDDDDPMRMDGDHGSGVHSMANQKEKETLENLVIKKTKVSESELFGLSRKKSSDMKDQKVYSKSQQDLYSSLIVLKETNKLLTEENQALKNRLLEADAKKMENEFLHQHMTKFKCEIGVLKNEIQLLRNEREERLHFKDVNALKLVRHDSMESVEWDSSDANVPNTRISKKQDKEQTKSNDISVSVRLLSIEEAIKDIVSILKIMNKMVVQQKWCKRREMKSRKLESQFDKLTVLQTLVNELVVVAQDDTKLSEFSS